MGITSPIDIQLIIDARASEIDRVRADDDFTARAEKLPGT